MKTIIDNRDTIIVSNWSEVYEDGKRVEVSPKTFKHKQSIREIYFYQSFYTSEHGVEQIQKIRLDYNYLKELLAKCEEIQSMELNKELEYELPF